MAPIKIIETYDSWENNRLLRIEFLVAERYEIVQTHGMSYLNTRNWMKKVQHGERMGLDTLEGIVAEKINYIIKRFKK